MKLSNVLSTVNQFEKSKFINFHDENMDGKLDTNWLGVPTEGYGFSSGAEASMSAPSFEDASFSYDGEIWI